MSVFKLIIAVLFVAVFSVSTSAQQTPISPSTTNQTVLQPKVSVIGGWQLAEGSSCGAVGAQNKCPSGEKCCLVGSQGWCCSNSKKCDYDNFGCK